MSQATSPVQFCPMDPDDRSKMDSDDRPYEYSQYSDIQPPEPPCQHQASLKEWYDRASHLCDSLKAQSSAFDTDDAARTAWLQARDVRDRAYNTLGDSCIACKECTSIDIATKREEAQTGHLTGHHQRIWYPSAFKAWSIAGSLPENVLDLIEEYTSETR